MKRKDDPARCVASVIVALMLALGLVAVFNQPVPAAEARQTEWMYSPRINSVSPGRVRPGDTVTVTGKGFGFVGQTGPYGETVLAVRLDAAGSKVLSWSDTRVTFMVSKNRYAGAYNVSVTKTIRVFRGDWDTHQGAWTTEEVTSEPEHFLVVPYVSSFNPSTWKKGDVLTLVGDGFPAYGDLILKRGSKRYSFSLRKQTENNFDPHKLQIRLDYEPPEKGRYQAYIQGRTSSSEQVFSINIGVSEPQRYGVLVASDIYEAEPGEKKKTPQLNAVLDAKTIQSRLLLGKTGWKSENIKMVVDQNQTSTVSKQSVINALDWMRNNVLEGDTCLFYYSGHGNLNDHRKKSKGAYLAIAKGELARVKSERISDNLLANRLRSMRAKKVIVMLDCCHSGAFADALNFPGVNDLFACNWNEGAWSDWTDKTGRHVEVGLFTYFISETIRLSRSEKPEYDKNHDGKITTIEAFEPAKVETIENTKWKRSKQHPLFYENGESHVLVDFN